MGIPSNRQTVRVLLAEDDPADVMLIRKALEEAPLQVELDVVGDGSEALAYLRGEGQHAAATIPDLVVLDLKLPRMGGLEALQVMKADEQLRRVPVIILSTSDAPEDILRAYQLHGSCYLTKPSDVEEFGRLMGVFNDFFLAIVKLPPAEPAGAGA